MSKNQKLLQARDLAGKLFDLKAIELELMSEDEQERWQRQYPLLSKNEFDDVRQQTLKVKMIHQSQIGWQVIPRDLAVIFFCLVSLIFDLQAGIIAGIALLILLGIIFNVFYSEKLGRILSYSVWLTYPALILLGYQLIREGYTWWAAAAIVIMAWLLSFALDYIARIVFNQLLKIKSQLTNPKAQK